MDDSYCATAAPRLRPQKRHLNAKLAITVRTITFATDQTQT